MLEERAFTPCGTVMCRIATSMTRRRVPTLGIPWLTMDGRAKKPEEARSAAGRFPRVMSEGGTRIGVADATILTSLGRVSGI
jgi:hypothetical protein